MKILLSKESIAKIALLMLLSLQAFASMTMLVNAAKPSKAPNILVNGGGSVELTWKSGKTETYSSDGYASLGGLNTVTFIPTRGWHIFAVSIDGYVQEIFDEDGFSLIGVRVKNLISVTFKENDGMDDVAAGSNVEAFPNPDVFLIFNNVNEGGFAYAYTYSGVEIYIPPDPQSETWDISTNAIFDQSVTVILVVPLASLPVGLRLLSADVEVASADVNIDGVVDGDDVSDVANANPSQKDDPDSNYAPRLDQNDDGVIDDTDVNIVNNYNGMSVWEDITFDVVVDLDLKLVYVYGLTDHLSLFGIH